MKSITFQLEEDPFSKNARGISKTYHEVLILLKFLQTKPHVKNMNINYFDLYYTVNKNRDGKEEEDEYDNVYDICPNHFVGMKNIDDAIFRYRKMSSQINQFKLFILYKWRRNGKQTRFEYSRENKNFTKCYKKG